MSSLRHDLLRPAGIVILAVMLAAGCAPADIDSAYGKRRGAPGAESVNGTAVLAGLFESAGHRVMTWRRLSPKLEDFDTIVWFPDTFTVPESKHCDYLESWLKQRKGRTLVFVGRDYDAAGEYWRRVQPSAPPEQVAEVMRRSAVARAAHERRRAAIANGANCRWFTIRTDLAPRSIEVLEGPWSAGIDGKKAEIRLDSRCETASSTASLGQESAASGAEPVTYQKLLFSDADLLVSRITRPSWDGGQILLVTNGSYLLNMPLVNHEHRKLAARLVNAVGGPGRVAFLESDEQGPPILNNEPSAAAPTGFEVFTVWPIGVILLHLTALGMLSCLALFPIFGRRRELPPVATADFGEHVAAVGELLELTANREYARQRIQQFEDQLKPEGSGRRT